MNINGISKHVGKMPDFWPRKFQSKIPKNMKDWVFDQYFNRQVMSIYCDASIAHHQRLIGVACSYVANGSVLVKREYIHPPSTFYVIPPIYAEIKSVIFTLKHFENYVNHCIIVIKQ